MKKVGQLNLKAILDIVIREKQKQWKQDAIHALQVLKARIETVWLDAKFIDILIPEDLEGLEKPPYDMRAILHCTKEDTSLTITVLGESGMILVNSSKAIAGEKIWIFKKLGKAKIGISKLVKHK